MTVLNVVPGTPEIGLWCETCLLPGRYQVQLFVLDDSGPRQIGTHSGCDSCEAAK